MYCVTFLSVNAIVLISGHAVNYCGSKMCGYSNEHTLCKYSEGPAPNCVGYIQAALTNEEKSRILARLNRRRNEVASGKLRGLPTAGNMMKLRWVRELAREAQLWADQCRPPTTPEENDVCRDLYSTPVGQCVASVVGEAPGLRVESMVDIWYAQGMFYKKNITSYEPPQLSQHNYADFAQMIWAKTFMVGCGRSRFMVPYRGRLRTIERLVCNFSPRGPQQYRALWSPGVPTLDCPTRSKPDKTLTSLCDYQQDLEASFRTNNSLTMKENVLLNAIFEMERNETQLLHGCLDEIYLTNLAIITMQTSTLTSPHYNSIQKRDVIEIISTDDGNMITNKFKLLIKNIFNTTIGSVIQTITRAPKKKLKLIGRPKAYNVEDLSGTGDHTKENDDTNDVLQKRKKHFYDEYNVVDSIEEKIITTTEPTTILKAKNEYRTEEYHNLELKTTESVIPITTMATTPSKVTTDVIITVHTTEINLNITTENVNESLAATIRKAEDYFTDPETVLQLQAALDRMEHKGEENLSGSSGKVRRDLRDLPADVNQPSPEFIRASDFGKFDSTQHDQNNSGRAPMLNMMLKYMPYLKPYERELLGGTASSQCVGPSMLLIVFCAFI